MSLDTRQQLCCGAGMCCDLCCGGDRCPACAGDDGSTGLDRLTTWPPYRAVRTIDTAQDRL